MLEIFVLSQTSCRTNFHFYSLTRSPQPKSAVIPMIQMKRRRLQGAGGSRADCRRAQAWILTPAPVSYYLVTLSQSPHPWACAFVGGRRVTTCIIVHPSYSVVARMRWGQGCEVLNFCTEYAKITLGKRTQLQVQGWDHNPGLLLSPVITLTPRTHLQ